MLRCFIWIGLAAPLLAGAVREEAASKYIHPDAKFLMGIELRRIAESPAGAILRKQMKETSPLPGFDLLADVDRILFSSPGQREEIKDSSPDKNTKATAGEPPFLMVITGRFDLQKLREFAVEEGEMLARYGTVELLAPSHGKTTAMHIGLVSPTLILAGDAISLREAIDRSTLLAPPPAQGALFRRAAVLAGANDVWMTGTISPADFASQGVPAGPMFSDIRAMEMAMSLQQGLGMRLRLTASNAAAAARLNGAILLMTQLGGAAGSDAGTADLLKNLQVKQEGAHVTLSLALNAASFERGLAQLRFSKKPATEVASVTVGRPSTALPPEKRVIRVMGAEEGPREIAFDAPKP